MGNLASTYLALGEYQKATELKVIVLEKQKQLLGDNDPDTISDNMTPNDILVPEPPFILTLIAKMPDKIVDKTESEVD
jgi:hypothetical protein